MTSRFTFITYAFFSLLIISAITYYTDQKIVNSYNEQLIDDLVINLDEFDTLMTKEYRSFREDITFLYSTPPVSGLTRAAANDGIDPLDGTTSELWLGRLGNIFTSFLENNSAYFQLRVIDKNGVETLRVDRRYTKVVKRANNDLQDKSDRYYFTETAMLPEEHLFVSVIDLNREYGQILFPYQPTLRLARPIYSDNNEFFGIIIANIDVSSLLDSAKHLVAEKYHILLTDVDGYFIKHPNQNYKFSRDLANQITFDNTYQISSVPNTPLALYYHGDNVSWGMSREMVVAANERGGHLNGTILLPDRTYTQELYERRADSFLAFVGVLLLALFAFYFLSRNTQRLSKLLSSAEEAKAALDVAEDAVITVDSQWHISSVNRAFERLFLRPGDDVKGQSIATFLTENGDAELALRISNNSNFDYSGYEWKFTPPNTSTKWLYTKVACVQSAQSGAAYAIAISDISGEKEALQRLESVNKDLEMTVAERTEELQKARDKALEVSDLKSNFISTISHEMRTPLNGIVGATSILKTEPLTGKQIKLVSMAENSVEALHRLINDVLDLSKIEAGKLELNFRHFNPEALVETITSTMSVVANEKQLGFYIDTNDLHFASIHSDPDRLSQVINNLLNNAIKFTNSGHIYVRAWSEIKQNISYLHVEVKDTGVGIADANLEKLFHAFSQADSTISSQFGGTGLGLSISKEIITVLGGEISVNSVEGKGSVFTFDIPIESWQEKSQTDQTRLANLTAGIIIDKPPLALSMRRLVEGSGGTMVDYTAPFCRDKLAQLSYLFVDISHPSYQDFCAFWEQLSSEEQQTIKLIVLSKISQPKTELPKGALNLIKPLYRSVFLSLVVNERSINAYQPPPVSLERRSSDLANTREAKISKLTCKILVVDDNEINSQVAKFILEPLGTELEFACNGQIALSMLQHTTTAFDVVLMDCNMPVMDGYETTKAIREGHAGERHRSIPIIAMTANAMKGENEKCYAVGMDDYITKPVDPALLIRKINHHNGTRIKSPPPISDTTLQTSESTSSQPLWQKDTTLVRLGGNEDLLVKLMTLFVASIDEKFDAFKNANATKDLVKLRFTAHTFKGNCGDVGAVALHSTFKDIEQHIRDGDLTGVDALIEKAKTQLAATISLFNDYLAKRE